MALIVSNPIAAEFFASTDPYNWTTDNRPLQKLLNNDIAINAELEAVRDEVVQARTGIVSTYGTLDLRLDAMESSIGASVSIDDMEDLQGHQYGDFIASAEAIRRATPSGWLDTRGIADLQVGTPFDDFAGIRTTVGLGAGYENSIVLWTQWGDVSTYRPIRAVVNGWIVRLFNEDTGSPTTSPANHVTIGLGTASAGSGSKLTKMVFLEVWLAEVDKTTPVFYKYGAVNTLDGTPTTDDHLHPEVISTIRGMAPGGNWIQVRHRLRVIDDITDPISTPFGFGAETEAQGGEGAPVSGYTFTSMIKEVDDAGLWRAGDGDETSQEDLLTYDGFVYAIPLAMVHRRNSGDWSIANQNGSRKASVGASGYLTSGLSGRPDGLYYDAIDQRDILDMRHKVSLSGFDLKELLDRTWQSLIRGELTTSWRELEYDYDNNGVWEGTNTFGHLLTMVDEIANTPGTNTNPVRDRAVTGAPLSEPDGVRAYWSKTPYMQAVRFSFTQGNAGSASPSGFVTYNAGTETLTFNAAALSGAGVGGTKIAPNLPVVLKKTDLTARPTVQTTGLGTQTAVCKITGSLTAAAEYVGFLYVVYPGGSGLEYAPKRILSHEVVDAGVTSYPSEQYGVTGSPGTAVGQLASPRCIARQSTGHLIISDTLNHRVIRVHGSTWAITHQFGTTGTSGATNSTLNTPTGVAVDASDNVYVCDTSNHRVVKLSSTLVYSTQFGTVTGVAGATNSTTNSPKYCAISGTQLLVTDSGNHRLLSLTATTMTYSTQFGTTASAGAGKLGLNGPVGVTTATSGFGAAIWVTDTGNSRVVVLDTSLVFKYQITNRSSFSVLNDQYIKDVAVDSDGNIYVLIGQPQGTPVAVLKKYNSAFVLTHQVGGIPGNTTSPVRFANPSGIALDQDPLREYIYVADSANHRVLRLNMADLTYVGQFGVTGNSTVGNTACCPFPSDVAVDNNGNLFITNNEIHRLTKVNVSLAYVSAFGYGSFKHLPSPGTPGFTASTEGLRNPLGVAVNPAGTVVMVCDTNNKRIMVFNGSLTYTNKFRPKYDTSVISRELALPTDVECLNDGGNDIWYVTGIEIPLGTNPQNLVYSVTWAFEDEAPTDTATNYDLRLQNIDIAVGCYVTATKIFVGTEFRGVAIYDRATPSIVEYTADPTLSIYFDFTKPTGISSTGSDVYIAEPDLHCVHRFSAIDGVFLGSAGVPYEQGNGDVRLSHPEYLFVHTTDVCIIADTANHRVLRRHVSSPWISKGGTISTLVPPTGSDKVRIFYEMEAYQGIAIAGTAVFKHDVRQESDRIFVSTMGLGESLTNMSNFLHLRGMTTRLPLPNGWTDYQISPLGMKVGASNDSSDDGPYLAMPVSVSEGLMGVNIAFSESAALAARAYTQQVCRLAAGTPNPKSRGYKSFLPLTNQVTFGSVLQKAADVLVTSVPEGGRSLVDPIPTETKTTIGVARSTTALNLVKERPGFPTIRSNNLQEGVPHFTYYPFITLYRGRYPVLVVLAEASNGKDVSLGNSNWNAVDMYYLANRTLFR